MCISSFVVIQCQTPRIMLLFSDNIASDNGMVFSPKSLLIVTSAATVVLLIEKFPVHDTKYFLVLHDESFGILSS